MQDFAWWSGLTMADAKHGIASLDRHLRKTTVDEKEYLGPRSVETLPKSDYSAHLLPAYDEYTVAYRDRQAIAENTKPLMARLGLLEPLVIIDGRLAGTWKRTNAKNQITIMVHYIRALTNSEKDAIIKAADRYAAFLSSKPQNEDRLKPSVLFLKP